MRRDSLDSQLSDFAKYADENLLWKKVKVESKAHGNTPIAKRTALTEFGQLFEDPIRDKSVFKLERLPGPDSSSWRVAVYRSDAR